MNDSQKNLTALRKHFPGEKIFPENISLIHQGRFANARVFRYQGEKHDLIIKDFSHCLLPIRLLVGLWAIRLEVRALKLLQGIRGISAHVYKIGPYTMAYDYIGGETVARCRDNNSKLPVSFFNEFDRMVDELHKRGLAHLDLRNLKNVLVGDDKLPWFIDFQSSVLLKSFPKSLSNILRDVDKSAVCKAWDKYCEEPLPEEKRLFLEEFSRKRKFWVFRGYMFSRYFEKLKKQS